MSLFCRSHMQNGGANNTTVQNKGGVDISLDQVETTEGYENLNQDKHKIGRRQDYENLKPKEALDNEKNNRATYDNKEVIRENTNQEERYETIKVNKRYGNTRPQVGYENLKDIKGYGNNKQKDEKGFENVRIQLDAQLMKKNRYK